MASATLRLLLRSTSEGRISQLAQEDRVLDAVRKRKEELVEEDVTEVTELKNIKKTLLGKLEELATSSESLSESVNAFEKIDKIISTKMGQENSDNGVRAIIMQAPIFIQQNLPSEVVLDSRNRIASIRVGIWHRCQPKVFSRFYSKVEVIMSPRPLIKERSLSQRISEGCNYKRPGTERIAGLLKSRAWEQKLALPRGSLSG